LGADDPEQAKANLSKLREFVETGLRRRGRLRVDVRCRNDDRQPATLSRGPLAEIGSLKAAVHAAQRQSVGCDRARLLGRQPMVLSSRGAGVHELRRCRQAAGHRLVVHDHRVQIGALGHEAVVAQGEHLAFDIAAGHVAGTGPTASVVLRDA
jgi:hypothetical protein